VPLTLNVFDAKAIVNLTLVNRKEPVPLHATEALGGRGGI
jgi:hypothetical protein